MGFLRTKTDSVGSAGRRKRPAAILLFTTLLLWPLAGQAQYPGHPAKDKAKPEQKLRSVAVLEWTGEPGKPSASRIIPIAVYDGERYQDGGLYLAQPAPLAVTGGTEYELEKAGTPQGLFDVFSAEHLQDSWYGYGVWRPLVVPKPHKLAKSKVAPTVVKDNTPDRPTLQKKSGDGSKTGDASKSGDASGKDSGQKSDDGKDSGKDSSKDTASNDPSRPTLHRRDDSGDSQDSSSKSSGDEASGSSKESPEDPDRPTLHKRADTSGDDTKRTSTDPDRPTLHKHSSDSGGGTPVTGMASEDPNRPRLRRGVPTEVELGVEPTKLSGRPPDLQQMAAISDNARGETHSFAYSWSNPDDQAKAQAALETLAKKALVQGGWTPLNQPVPGTKPKTTPHTAAARRAAMKKPVEPPLPPLTDEKLNSFELAYNGGATLVFTAKSGDVPNERYVTLIAQPDFYGVPHVLMQSVTDAEHLDVKPRMRFVDAVDTNGDNRAELIFELRSKTDRQFAIYRVSGGKVLQAFATTSMP